jgi:hypothetical protein
MEEVDFKEPKSYQRMKQIWNGMITKGYYTLKDCPEIKIMDKDNEGMNIYGRREEGEKEGLLF